MAHEPLDSRSNDSGTALLRVENLRVEFPSRARGLSRGGSGVLAVDGVSFAIRRGASLGLVGESGSGKSTVARAVLCLLDPAVARVSGTVEFDGRSVLGASRGGLRVLRRSMQIIFQDPGGSLNPRMRVRSILEEPLVVHRLAATREARRQRVAELLDQVALPRSSLERYPHEFSGGQRQRLAIARALAVSPTLLVCDEPTSALDVSVQAQILNLLGELRERLGLSLLFISHDLAVVRHLCEDVGVMRSGRIVEQGATLATLASPSHDYTRALLAAVAEAPIGSRSG